MGYDLGRVAGPQDVAQAAWALLLCALVGGALHSAAATEAAPAEPVQVVIGCGV